MKLYSGRMAGLLAAVFISVAISAKASFVVSGNFNQDNDIAWQSFAITVDNSSVVLSTTSYAAGGFDPMLTVWNEFGTWYGANDDASAARDSYLDLVLPLGNYIVALTQFENYPNGAPSDGFTHDGEPWFTSQLWGNGQPGGFFDVAGNQRSSLWTMEVMGANVAPVPEPTTYLAGLLMLIPFGTAIVRTMRRQPQS